MGQLLYAIQRLDPKKTVPWTRTTIAVPLGGTVVAGGALVINRRGKYNGNEDGKAGHP